MHLFLSFSVIVQLNAWCSIDLWAVFTHCAASKVIHTQIGQNAFLQYDAILFYQMDWSGINLAVSFLLLLDWVHQHCQVYLSHQI